MVTGLELQWLLDLDVLDMAAVFADPTQSVCRVISVQPTDPPTTS